MDFERAMKLLLTSKAAEVPVLASTTDQSVPQRYILRQTYSEGGLTTLHLQTFPSTLSCPLSSHLTSHERHFFNNPSSAPATSPIHDLHRTVRVFHRPRGRLLYFCHETHIDSAVRPFILNNRRCIPKMKKAGIQLLNL